MVEPIGYDSISSGTPVKPVEPQKVHNFKGFWKVTDVTSNPNCLFVFGDNDISRGKKGQSIIRDCVNAIGIPTKKYPTFALNAFYTDSELESNKKKIDIAIQKVIDKSVSYQKVYLPEDGFGTGLANLPIKAPKTYSYLLQKLELMIKEINSQSGLEKN